MTTSSIQRSLIPAVCVAGAIFAASTAPLAMYRSEVVAVELQNRPLFTSEVRDLAGPYLGVVGLISASLGASIMAFSGWRQAARKSEAAESKLSGLQRDLLTQQSELEEIKFSEVRLRSQNLDAFLEPQTSLETLQHQVPQRAPLAAIPSPPAAPAAASVQSPSGSRPQIVPVGKFEEIPFVSYAALSDRQTQASSTASEVKGKAMLALSAAQSYASYARSSSPTEESSSQDASGSQLDQLLVQLQQLASQVEELRADPSRGLAA